MNMCIPVYPGVNEAKFERWEMDSGLYYNKGYDIDYMIPVQGEDDSAALAQKVISFYKGKVINRVTE